MLDFLTKGIEGIRDAFYGLYQVSRGLKTVGDHSFREPTTQQYPDVMPTLSPHFRGRLALTVNPETGEHLCISCRQCERVCPDKCIEITAHKSPETNKLELLDFKIDHGLCMFCGLCTEVCPTACIINTQDFEMADYTRSSLIYDLKKLTLTQEESGYYFEAKEMPLPKPKPAKAAPAAGAAAKPAGQAVAPAADAKAPTAAPEAKAAAPATATDPKPSEAPTPAPAESPPPKPAEAPKPAPTETPQPLPAEAPSTPAPVEAPQPAPSEVPAPTITEPPMTAPTEASAKPEEKAEPEKEKPKE
jgi:NADH-quinone oxidoreductase subunit I